MKRRGTPAGVLIMMLVAACGNAASPAAASTTLASLSRPAAEFAASAERALQGTDFEQLGRAELADLVTGLCDGFGIGAIPATIEGLDAAASAGDREILAEVLKTGTTQVCPDRAPVDLTPFYVDAVRVAAQAAEAMSAYDESAVVRTGPVVCAALVSGVGVEGTLLDVVESLFGVSAEDIVSLAGVVDAEQGVVAGAVLASATALLCPEYAGEVETFMETL